MKQEFITQRGKLVIENDRLIIRNFLQKNRSDLYWIAFNLLFCIMIIESDSRAKPLAYVMLAILGIMILISLAELLFVNSWKNKFHLGEIRSYKVLNDHIGLETTVILKFHSGKQKEIVFRSHEKQHEAFLDLISQYTVQTQFA